MSGAQRADACVQAKCSTPLRWHNNGLQLENALYEHAARGSGRRLRPPARPHCETAMPVAYRSVGEMAAMCMVDANAGGESPPAGTPSRLRLRAGSVRPEQVENCSLQGSPLDSNPLPAQHIARLLC